MPVNKKALKYCYVIIRSYFFDDLSSELKEQIQAWLINGEHCIEKNIAMEKVFKEFMEKHSGESESSELDNDIAEELISEMKTLI